MNSFRGDGEEPIGLVDHDVDYPSRARQVDADVFEPYDDFYRRTYADLMVLARALVGSAAEDVAQEVMLETYRKWDDVRRFASPVGWARRVCLHKAVSLLRRRSVEQRVLRRVAGSSPIAVDAGVDGTDWFWSLVRQLPARQAQAVALHYALDLAVSDVAQTMGCSEGTVKVHLSRARESLGRAVKGSAGGQS